MNLGWKLAATIKGKAPPGLLDSYHAERHPAGARVLDWSRAQAAAMAPEPGPRALHAILRELLATRDGATYAAGRVWGVQQRYDLGAGHPLAGRSLPDFAFDDDTVVVACLRAGRGFLLDFDNTNTRATLAEEYGIAHVRLSQKVQGKARRRRQCECTARRRNTAMRLLRQPHVAAAAPECMAMSCLLVRPDGIVAWASDAPDDDGGLRDAMTRWFAA
jgi:hypothetical protein